MVMTMKTLFQLQGALLAGFAVALLAAWLLPGRLGELPLLVAWLFSSFLVFRWMRRRWPVTPADETPLPSLDVIAGRRRESLYEVRVADGELVVWHPAEDEVRVALEGIDAVALETDDSGPVGSDVRWRLRSGDRIVVVPLGATGEDGLMDWVQSLPGVDNEAIVEAMGSTTIGRFTVWTRG